MDKIIIDMNELPKEEANISLKETIRVSTKFSLNFENETGKLQLIATNGKVVSEVDLPTEKVITNAYYDDDNKELVIDFESANQVRIPIDFTDEIEKAVSDFENKVNEQFLQFQESVNQNIESLNSKIDNLEDTINNNIGKQVESLNESIEEINNSKVDKVDGKQLSTNDLTNELLNKLNSLNNYDDTKIQKQIDEIKLVLTSDDVDFDTLQELVNALKNNTASIGDIFTALSKKIDKVDGKGLSTNDFTNEEKTKLSNLENYDDSEIMNLLNGKVDKSNEPFTFIDLSNYSDINHLTLLEMFDKIKNLGYFTVSDDYSYKIKFLIRRSSGGNYIYEPLYLYFKVMIYSITSYITGTSVCLANSEDFILFKERGTLDLSKTVAEYIGEHSSIVNENYVNNKINERELYKFIDLTPNGEDYSTYKVIDFFNMLSDLGYADLTDGVINNLKIKLNYDGNPIHFLEFKFYVADDELLIDYVCEETLNGKYIGTYFTYTIDDTESELFGLTESLSVVATDDMLSNYLPKSGGEIKGNLGVGGNIDANTIYAIGNIETEQVFYSEGGISTDGDLNVYGTTYLDDSMTINGNVYLYTMMGILCENPYEQGMYGWGFDSDATPSLMTTEDSERGRYFRVSYGGDFDDGFYVYFPTTGDGTLVYEENLPEAIFSYGTNGYVLTIENGTPVWKEPSAPSISKKTYLHTVKIYTSYTDSNNYKAVEFQYFSDVSSAPTTFSDVFAQVDNYKNLICGSYHDTSAKYNTSSFRGLAVLVYKISGSNPYFQFDVILPSSTGAIFYRENITASKAVSIAHTVKEI